ncbi:TPA: DUF5776 domain-containing protein, partial [Klebsiella pneumoniae]
NSPAYHEKVLAIAAEKRKMVRQYIQQEINPKEKFAFVEFWGRGYTQDTFGRLLNDAFGKEVKNPFYYVRSFTDDMGTSVRHNFILAPQNFSFFEPIFAQTPYDSIPDYYEEKGRIEPIINHRDRSVSDLISEGLLKFTEDYLALNTQDEDYFDAALSQFNYQYQLNTPNDQFICNVFSELKDNISSFGVEKPYAPALTLKQLESITSKQELDKLTQSIPISLSKSDVKVIDYYNKIQKNYNLPAYNSTPMRKAYAVNPLEQYVWSTQVPFRVLSLKQNSFYLDVSFAETTKRKDIFLKELNEIDVIAVDWLKGGVPRLLTEHGYITAHEDWVKKSFNDDKTNNIEEPKVKNKEKSKVLEVNTTVTNNNKQAIGKLDNNIDKSNKEQKKRKLARNPYAFFNDSKKPILNSLKHLFNESHSLGRLLSRIVRKTLNHD